jgi:hypothetical protein
VAENIRYGIFSRLIETAAERSGVGNWNYKLFMAGAKIWPKNVQNRERQKISIQFYINRQTDTQQVVIFVVLRISKKVKGYGPKIFRLLCAHLLFPSESNISAL